MRLPRRGRHAKGIQDRYYGPDFGEVRDISKVLFTPAIVG